MRLVSNERAQWLARHVLPHEPALRAWLARRAPSDLEIDDIVQETYSILAALERVDHIQTPRNYMFEVAKSVFLQAVRRSRIIAFETITEVDRLEIPSAEPSPETITAHRQELSRIAALIAGLPQKCREAFTLRKVHGLSQREVAVRMGVSENTVEKHIGKAIGVLMEAMGRGGNDRLKASKEREVRGNTELGKPRKQRRN
jgi:RNA polymerase sigma factor (sigma-70 family)